MNAEDFATSSVRRSGIMAVETCDEVQWAYRGAFTHPVKNSGMCFDPTGPYA